MVSNFPNFKIIESAFSHSPMFTSVSTLRGCLNP
jgi:hypothetical protein